jgi:hypothetical protein
MPVVKPSGWLFGFPSAIAGDGRGDSEREGDQHESAHEIALPVTRES